MQKSDETSMSKSSHRKMQTSTTLSRKYTRRPSMKSEIKIPKSLKINRFSESEMSGQSAWMEMMSSQSGETSSRSTGMTGMTGMMQDETMMSTDGTMQPESTMSMKKIMQTEASMNERPVYAPETMPVYPDYPDYPDYPEESMSMYPVGKSANMKMSGQTRMSQQPVGSMRSTQPMSSMKSTQPMKSTSISTLSGVTAKEMKEQAIKKAMSSANKVESTKSKKVKKSKKVSSGMHFGFGRVLLALTCASVAVMAIVYFVNLNMPDISLSVAAIQNGMKVVYPNYIPRDYSVSSVTSEEGKVTMTFDNAAENKSFSLIEESSSWDSNALLANYVKSTYGENYTVVKEQGLTLYISGSNAAWVNGGNVYKITADNGVLTNKQIKSIAVSL